MCLVRNVIHPIQHLFVVIGIMITMLGLTSMEESVVKYAGLLDRWIFNDNAIDWTHTVVDGMNKFIEQDYKRSQIRRFIKRGKRYINYFLQLCKNA